MTKFLLLIFLLLTGLGLTQELSTAEKMAEVDAMIAKQRGNVQKMRAELDRNPKNPDGTLLRDSYATATGSRSAAFKKHSAYMQGLINRFEKNLSRNLGGAVALATGVGRSRGQFIVELNRSEEFIKELQAEQTRLKSEAAGAVWRGALGTWANGGAVIRIYEEDGSVTATFEEIRGNLTGYRIESGDYLFIKGVPSADKKTIVSKIAYTYVAKGDCPKLEPNHRGKAVVRVLSADEIEIEFQVCQYYSKRCEWSDQFVTEKGVYKRK